MSKIGITISLAIGAATALIGLTPLAGATAAQPGNAQQTIDSLRANGFTVLVEKVGDGPLDRATVTGVRPGHVYSHTDHSEPGPGLVTTVTDKTVYVDVD